MAWNDILKHFLTTTLPSACLNCLHLGGKVTVDVPLGSNRGIGTSMGGAEKVVQLVDFAMGCSSSRYIERKDKDYWDRDET